MMAASSAGWLAAALLAATGAPEVANEVIATRRVAVEARVRETPARPRLAFPEPAVAPTRPPAPTPAPAAPLTLAEVLASSARHAPQVLEALARVRAAEGREVSASGAFDTVFAAEGQSRPVGFYDGTYVEGRASRPLLDNGGALYAGYRLSDGRFPIYEDRAFTNRLGEAKAGVVFALLRDRHIDERRFQLGASRLETDVAELEARMVALGVQRRAALAWQQWVTAGLRLAVYRDLLALAENRQSAFARQVELGARARILLTENAQNLVRRQTLLTRAEQELASAANTLSFFLRDAAGQPVVAPPERLPASLAAFAAAPAPTDLSGRPDLAAIERRLEIADRRLDLERNNLRPRLDLRFEAARDFGPLGAGGRSRDGTEGIVGFTFSVPLEQRTAIGRIAQARADRQAQRARRTQLENEIRIAVDGVLIEQAAARRLVDLAAEEARLATLMAEAERKRFQLGAADFIIVNLREEAAADARLRRLDADLRLAGSGVELAAATADAGSLDGSMTP